ncbi:MAG TPA: hypothetical protein VFK05_29730 [Polyangiaceae bacterium]|nr:hypothetical protein [Polyangiaceae bacterium]
MPKVPVRWKPLAAGFGAFLTFLNGCSSSDTDAALVSRASFPERFASSWCQTVAPCCEPEHVVFDLETCRSHAREFATTLLESGIDAGKSYGPSAGTNCLSRLERALQNCELEAASSACASIFVGDSPNGTPCENGSECTSGYCALGEVGLSGVCAEASFRAPRHGELGEACVGSCGVPGSFQCPTSLLPNAAGVVTYCYAEDGFYCAFDPDALPALSCQRYAALGAPCGNADVRCSPGTFCADGACVPQRASGPCENTPEQCDAHSYCDPNQQCQPKQPNGAACFSGETCTSSSCSSDGRSEGVCDSGSSLLSRACSGSP